MSALLVQDTEIYRHRINGRSFFAGNVLPSTNSTPVLVFDVRGRFGRYDGTREWGMNCTHD